MQREKNYIQILSAWFRQLDVREDADFKDAEEEALLERRMEMNLRNHIFNPDVKPGRNFPFWLPGIAASLLLLAFGAWWFATNKTQRAGVNTYYETTTVSGERKVITLNDGTRIFLNNASKIKYAKSYLQSNRLVYLEGEAYFEVVHNKSKPFIVQSGKLNVHVLGTSFNVKAYNSDPKIAVTVSTGKVGVVENGKKKAWMLVKGDQLNYIKESGVTIADKVRAEDYMGWTSGQLVFNNERMDDICRQLGRTYGVQVNIASPYLNNKRINLKVNNENISTIVKMLSLTGKFNYTIKEKEIKIW